MVFVSILKVKAGPAVFILKDERIFVHLAGRDGDSQISTTTSKGESMGLQERTNKGYFSLWGHKVTYNFKFDLI